MACEETLSIFGVQKFLDLRFEVPVWKLAKETASELHLVVKRSSIPNAGKGVFCHKNTTLDGGETGLYLMDYQGEPMEEWIYDGIETRNLVFTGIAFQLPNSNVSGIWRGVSGTLGPTINSITSKPSDASVEFRMNYEKIDWKQKIFHSRGFIEVWVKPHAVIKPNEELFVYYTPKFWKQYQLRVKELQEDYCCMCLLYSSNLKNPLLLCDNCCSGFHLECLHQFGIKNVNIKQDPWYCFHCKK